MADMQAVSRAAGAVLAATIDIEEMLELRHVARQCVAEREEMKRLLSNFSSAAAGLDERPLREAVLRWALDMDPGAALSSSKHPLALMVQSRTALAAQDFARALELSERAAKEAPTEVFCVLGHVEALRASGKVEEALKKLESLRREFSDRGEYSYQEGRCHEDMGRYEQALASYARAQELNPGHYRALFRLACLADLRGDEQGALECYRRIGPGRAHAFVSAALNMALLHEDLTEYEKAKACCRSVLNIDPNNHRARLFLRDIEESEDMYYSPEEAKETERIEAVLRVPVSDFELSVRSRNCLTRMNIRSLGDLVRKTEQEMLSYKNFGETSLREIKEMLNSKGLRLGMLREEGGTRTVFDRRRPPEGVTTVDSTSIDELELSVRSRKCMERLGIATLGDLFSLSESDLLSAKNFGRVSMQEIKAKLAERGLSLRQG